MHDIYNLQLGEVHGKEARTLQPPHVPKVR